MCGVVVFVMLFYGLMTLVKGRCSLGRGRVAQGAPARVAGLVLCLPLPLGFFISLVLGIRAAAMGGPIDPRSLLIVDLELLAGHSFRAFGLTVGCLLLSALITTLAGKPIETYSFPRHEQDDRDPDAERVQSKAHHDRPRRRPGHKEERDRGEEHIKPKD